MLAILHTTLQAPARHLMVKASVTHTPSAKEQMQSVEAGLIMEIPVERHRMHPDHTRAQT